MEFYMSQNLKQIKALRNSKIKTNDNQRLLNVRMNKALIEIRRLHAMADRLKIPSARKNVLAIAEQIKHELDN